MPPVAYCVHTYATTNTVDVPIGATSAISSMNLNGMWDPDPLLGGHQPVFRDNMAALYRNYKVYKAKCECWVRPLFNQPLGGIVYAEKYIATTSDSGEAWGVRDINSVMEDRRVRWKEMPYSAGIAAAGPAGDDLSKQSIKFTTWFHSKDMDAERLVGNSNVAVNSGTNPTQIARNYIVYLPHYAVSVASNFLCRYRITFYTVWSNPIQQVEQ